MEKNRKFSNSKNITNVSKKKNNLKIEFENDYLVSSSQNKKGQVNSKKQNRVFLNSIKTKFALIALSTIIVSGGIGIGIGLGLQQSSSNKNVISSDDLENNLKSSFSNFKEGKPSEPLYLVTSDFIVSPRQYALDAEFYLNSLTPKRLEKSNDINPLTERTFNATESQKYFTDSYYPPEGVTIKYFHDGLTEDGNLVLHFTISEVSSTITRSVSINIPVIGINQAKAKAYLESLTQKYYDDVALAPLPNSTGILDNSNAYQFFVLEEGSYQSPRNVVITYQVSSFEDKTFTVTFTITRSESTTTQAITLTKRYIFEDDDIDNAIAYLKSVTRYARISWHDLPAVSNKKFLGNDEYELPPGLTITFTSDSLTEDGDVVIHYVITKTTNGSQITVTLDTTNTIIGINFGKARTFIENLTPKSPALTTATTISSLEAKEFTEEVFTKYFQGTYIPQHANIEITYSHSELTEDGDLVITFTLLDKVYTFTTTITKTIAIKGINFTKEKSYIESLTPKTSISVDREINYQKSVSFDEETFTKYFQGTYKPPYDGVAVTYTHNRLTKDGDLNFTFTISDGQTSVIVRKTIAVTGIDLGKAKAYLESLTQKFYYDATSAPLAHSSGTLNQNNANNFFEFGEGSYQAPENVIITYQVSAIEEDSFRVTFTITKRESSTEPITLTKSYVFGDEDIDGAIAYLKSVTRYARISWHDLPAVSNKNFLGNDEYELPPSLTITFSSDSLTEDGDVVIHYVITKTINGNQITVTLDTTNTIIGINYGKARTFIENLTPKSPAFTTTTIIPSVESMVLSEEVFTKYFQGTYIPQHENIKITYSHSELAANGDLVITFTLLDKVYTFTTTITKTIAISGFTSVHQLVNAQNYIESLIPKTNALASSDIALISEETLFDGTTFAKYFQGTYVPQAGVTITYTHNGLTEDGDLNLVFTISNERTSVIVRKTIAISGINQAKAKAYLESLTQKSYYDSTIVSSLASSGTLDDSNANLFFEFEEASYQAPKKVTITYQISPLENDSFTITFTIAKNEPTITRPITLTLSYTLEDSDVGNAINYLKRVIAFEKILNGIVLPVEETTFTEDLARDYLYQYHSPSGVIIKFYHEGLTEDGILVLHFTVIKATDATIRQTLEKNVVVKGINLARAKAYIKSLTPKASVSVDGEISELKETSFNEEAFNKYFESTYNAPFGVTITYSHGALTANGNLNLHFRITDISTKSSTTVIKTVYITGIKEVDHLEVAKSYVQNFVPKTTVTTSEDIAPLSEETILDDTIFSKYFEGTYTPPARVTVTYTHNGLTEDGDLNFVFTITNGETSITIRKTVAITGIDQGKAKTYLNGLMQRGFIDATLAPSSNSRGTLSGDNVDMFFKVDADSYQPPRNVVITYQVSAIVDDSFSVTFTITRNEPSTSEPITLVKSYVFGDEDVDNAIAYLKTLRTFERITTTDILPLTETTFREDLGRTYLYQYQAPSGVIIKFSHDGLTADGTLVLHLIVIKTTDSSIRKKLDINVVVSGINLAKAKAYIKSLIPKEFVSVNNEIASLEATPFDEQTFRKYFRGAYSPPQGVTITYSHASLTTNGNLNLHFVIRDVSTHNSTTVTKTVVIRGINLAKAKVYMERLISKPSITSDTVIAKVDSERDFNEEIFEKYFRGVYSPPSGITITYTHNGLTEDGDLTFVFILTNGQSSVTVWITVAVSGITAANLFQQAKSYVENFVPKTIVSVSEDIAPLSEETILDETTFSQYFEGTYNPPTSVTVSYTHNGLIEDGNLNFVFTITNGKSSVTVRKTVAIRGITAAHLLQQAKSYVENFVPKTRVTASEDIAPLSEETILDETTFSQYFEGTYNPPTSVTVSYTHNGLTEDGDLNFVFTIANDKTSVTVRKTVAITGIDQGKAKTYLESLTLHHYEDESPISSFANSSGTLNFHNANYFFTFLNGENYQAPHNVVIGYQVSSIEDDSFTVTFTITRNESTTEPIILTKNYIIGDLVIYNAVQYIKSLTKREFNEDGNIPPLRELTFTQQVANIFFSSNFEHPEGVNIGVAHDGLTEDGDLVLHFDLFKTRDHAISKSFDINIPVKGINFGKAVTFVRTLIPKTEVIRTSPIPSLTETPFNKRIFRRYFDRNYQSPPPGITITYSHEGIDEDGYLILHFTVFDPVNQFTLSQVKWIPIVGLNDTKNLTQAKTYIESFIPKTNPLASSDITAISEETLFDETTFTKYFQGTYTSPTGVTVTYIHNGLTEDGNLNFVFILTTDYFTNKARKTIAITGIDQGKAKTYLESLTLRRYNDMSLAPPPNSTGTLNIHNAHNFFQFEEGESYQTPKNVWITYRISGIENYHYTVTFVITRFAPTTTSPLTLTKTYIVGDSTIEQAISYLKSLTPKLNQKNDIPPLTNKFFDASEAAIYFQGTYISPNGVTITFSTTGLTEDGTLTLHFTIVKDSDETIRRTLDISLPIRGINLSKAKNYIKSLTTKGPLEVSENIPAVVEETIFDDTLFTKYFQGTYTPPKEVTITYTHNGLIHDGNLVIRFTITNNFDDSTTTVTKTLVITGLTNTHTTNALDFITSLTPQTNLQFNSDIAPVIAETVFNKATFEKYFQGAYNPPSGVLITFTHPGLTHDGYLVIRFTINLGDASRYVSKMIHVSGINEGKGKTYFDSLIPKSVINFIDDVPSITATNFDSTEFSKYFQGKFVAPPKGVIVRYSHGSFTHDGNYELLFTYESEGFTLVVKKTILIQGIDQGKAKTYLESLTLIHFDDPSLVPPAGESGVVTPENANKFFDLRGTSYQAPHNVVVAYLISEIKDYQYSVTFSIIRNKPTTTKQIIITKTYFIGNPNIAKAIGYLNSLTRRTLNDINIEPVTTRLFDEIEARKYFIDSYVAPEGVIIKYSHGRVINAQNLILHFTIFSEDNQEIWKKYEIKIPLDLSVFDKAQVFIKNLTPKDPIVIYEGLNAIKTTIFDEEALNKYFTDSYTSFLGITITYAHGTLEHDGNFKLHFTITNNQDKTSISLTKTVYITGVDIVIAHTVSQGWTPKLQVLASDELFAISQFSPKPFTKEIFEKYFQGPYDPPRGVTITYHHYGLIHDGKLKLYITFKKGLSEITIAKSISIIGIDLPKAKVYLEGLTAKHFANIALAPAYNSRGTLNRNTAAQFFKFDEAGYQAPDNVIITYQVSEIIDDQFTVTFTLRSTKSQSLEPIIITKTYYIGDSDLTQASLYLKHLTPKKLTYSATIGAVTNKLFDSTEASKYFSDNYVAPKGVIIKYTSRGIINDKSLTLHFTIFKNTNFSIHKQVVITIPLSVTSLATVKSYLENLIPKDKIAIYAFINAKRNVLFDEEAFNTYFTGSYLFFPKITITYAHGTLDHDGNLELHFTITNNQDKTSTTLTKTVYITGIDIVSAYTYINNWIPKVEIVVDDVFLASPQSPLPFTREVFARYFQGTYNLPRGVIVTYYHDGLTEDGKLRLYINIEKGVDKTYVLKTVSIAS